MMQAVRQSQLFNSGIFTPMLTLFIATHVVWAQTWTQTCAPTNGWRCIASSADGSKVVAGQWPGTIYISTNSGATWAPSTAPNESWTSVASSADGCKLLAAAGNSPYPGGVFTSTNSGTAWISNSLPSMYWSSVASSADGNSLVAVAPYGESGGIPGAVFTSTNGGINLMSNTLNNPSGVTGNFPLGVAASADGRKMVVVEMFDVESPSSVFARRIQEQPGHKKQTLRQFMGRPAHHNISRHRPMGRSWRFVYSLELMATQAPFMFRRIQVIPGI